MYKPDDWAETRERIAKQLKILHYPDFEAGADAMWGAVCDKIADMSDGIKDDKMFRVKLFLWLTEGE